MKHYTGGGMFMEIKDLKIGDVVLFSPEKGSFISWAITFLTDAPVSHASIFYGEDQAKPSIIEETPPAVSINPVEERFVDRIITVRRLAGDLPLSPVIAAATACRNDAEPYDNASLYMVGVILVYKKFTPSSLVQTVIIKILKKITATLDAYINAHETPGKKPMVCSQFVAQCYEDAGAQYKLNFSGNLLTKVIGDSLLDQAIAIVENDKSRFANTFLGTGSTVTEEPSATAEQLCQELQDAFAQTHATLAAVGISSELIEAMHQFSQVNSMFISGDTRLSSTFPEDVSSSLQLLKDNENMFIFPGDLLLHCTSLKDAGTIN
jgi:hypothetical protein